MFPIDGHPFGTLKPMEYRFNLNRQHFLINKYLHGNLPTKVDSQLRKHPGSEKEAKGAAATWQHGNTSRLMRHAAGTNAAAVWHAGDRLWKHGAGSAGHDDRAGKDKPGPELGDDGDGHQGEG